MIKKTNLFIVLIILTCNIYSQKTVTDIDGNTYKIVNFGKQTWMTENLRTTKFNDGSSLIKGTKDNWKYYFGHKKSVGQVAFYDFNDDNKNSGGLYRFPGILKNDNQVKNICPKGWHVPSDNDWNILINYLGGANGLLQKISLTKGFNAKPTGFAHNNDYQPTFFLKKEESTIWWSSTFKNQSDFKASIYILNFSGKNQSNDLLIREGFVFSGFCVRCLKD